LFVEVIREGFFTGVVVGSVGAVGGAVGAIIKAILMVAIVPS